jgi:hypothetical protein
MPSRVNSKPVQERREFMELLSRGDAPSAVRRWREAGWQPRGLLELMMVGRALAQSGDEAAVPFLEQLRPLAPMEADTLLGVLRLRQGRWTESSNALEQAYASLQREPWGQRTVANLLLQASQELAQKEPSLGRRLYAHLDKPFSGYALEVSRHRARLAMARTLDWHGLCQKALEPYEQHPLWQEEFLIERAECYETNKSPLREQALASLSEFLDGEPPMLFGRNGPGAVGLPTPEPEVTPAVSEDEVR